MRDLIPGTAVPPITTKFTLGPAISPEQHAFLEHHGFLHFRGVASRAEVEVLRREQDRLEAEWLSRGVRELFGIPLFFGRGAGGDRSIQRIPFSSRFSPAIDAFVHDARFAAL